jgi:2-oxoglutarate ferredoxin oxidoreductase subunit gamma
MKERWEIILSGVGGQGLIISGTILGEAAVVYEGKNATLTSSYGTETRGTFAKSDVIISTGKIYFPEVTREDIILALAPAAYDRYISSMDREAMLIYDSGLISDVRETEVKQQGYPVTETARRLGNAAAANIVALGIIVGITGAVSEDSVVRAIKDAFANKPQVIELNIRAFVKGMEMAKA